jgi:methylmalonyl-CoA mutase C-terminal domain/subunit
MRERKIRILIAKPGLDGHDRGAKIVALALRDAGMEVIYTGLHQRVEQIVNTAVQEGVDIIGLSIMSGAHIPICEELLEMMRREGIASTGVVVGGVIPARDIAKLEKLGIKGVYPGGTSFEVMIKGIREIADGLIGADGLQSKPLQPL